MEGYGDAFLALGEQGVVPAELAARLRRAAGMRDVLVHGYVDVQPRLVWHSLAGVADLRRFAELVDGLLDA